MHENTLWKLLLLLTLPIAAGGCDMDAERAVPGAQRFRVDTPQVEAIVTDDTWAHIYQDHVTGCPRPGREACDTCFDNPPRSETAAREIITAYIQQVVDEAEESGWLPDSGPIYGNAGEPGEIIGTQGETEIRVIGRTEIVQGVYQFRVITAYPRRLPS